ncbi:TIGR02281 family clan AA aspartic protease [Rhodoferax sp. PAMC 29310]|uniref:retropepsin-like aspartic protease family protein n=1 Tax=Rhodoferax sp. PAMC 29310 TaxID=2822760 RepID=UPI001B343A8D|nr:retropepsin-like aspartic protease [Rhodoferax sp. PAMC 29310]
MGNEDRETRRSVPEHSRRLSSPSNSLKWGPLGIVVFWMVVMGALYLAMTHYLKPSPVIVSATGDLIIPRARDGHFYALGAINGQAVTFLVDTGASLVTVSETFAQSAGLAPGMPTVFQTANGTLNGRTVPDVPVTLGPLTVSGVRVGVGLVGGVQDKALLGQSFLARFDITLTKEQMILRAR